MGSRIICLHAFVSAKGGVGKSTLAVACASLLAADERRDVVLLDADLTGTSLADGLRLCAPDLPLGKEGFPDFYDLPLPPRYLSRTRTIECRQQRKSTRWTEKAPGLPPPPPFLNDLLIRGERRRECKVEALCWKHEDGGRVRYLPSSPLEEDIDIALGWLYHEEPFRWVQRMVWLIDDMRAQIPSLTDVVIDLPPGLFGFAHQVLALFAGLEGEEQRPLPSGFPQWSPGEWKTYPFLVTTPDKNDLAIAMEYRIAHRYELPGLEPLLNRYSAQLPLSRWFEEWFPAVKGLYEELEQRRVDVLGSLGRLFTQGYLDLSPDEAAQLRRSLWPEELP